MMDQIQRAKEANKSSPDLTHVKTIRMGDELFLMCQEVYKSPKYYLQVAEKNNILNFRKLKQGDKLLFPPLKS
jgi:nucleoid-associated protein YgaU